MFTLYSHISSFYIVPGIYDWRVLARKERADAKVHLLEACSQTPPSLEEVQAILELHGNAIYAQDAKDEKYALHKACWKGGQYDVIEYLVEKWPGCIRKKECQAQGHSSSLGLLEG